MHEGKVVVLQWCNAAASLTQAVSHAIRDMVEEGTLPETSYPAPTVREISSKQRRVVGPRAVLTTAAAYPIANAARRATGDQSCQMYEQTSVLHPPII